MDDEKKRKIEQALAGIEKQHGKGAIMRLGSSDRLKVEVISSGILPLDVALGVGGVPKGRIIEIYGPESGGKTTVALQLIESVQRIGGTAAFVDAERALDPVYAKNLGVNLDDLLISQPDTGEQALYIVDALTASGGIDLIVVDSVAALVPKAELEGDMGDSHVGLHARLMSQALRKLSGMAAKTGTTILFINQLREKVGVMFGNPEVTTGGRALRFWASVRMEIRRIEALKKDGVEIGHRAKIKVAKNKVAPPFRIAEVDILYGKGCVPEYSLVDMATELGFIKKSGSWYSYGENKIGQGREAAAQTLRNDPEFFAEIDALVRERLIG